MGGDAAKRSKSQRCVMLHFAYGSNMSRAVMRAHAPDAVPLGVATLANYRFVITADGYASVEPRRVADGPRRAVAARRRATASTLDAWENIAGRALSCRDAAGAACRPPPHGAGLYRPAAPVWAGRSAGYMEIVIAAARSGNCRNSYIASLRHWLPYRLAAGPRKLREFGWT